MALSEYEQREVNKVHEHKPPIRTDLGPPSAITLLLLESVLLEPQRLDVFTDGVSLGLIESRRIDGRDFDPHFEPRAVDPGEWLKGFR